MQVGVQVTGIKELREKLDGIRPSQQRTVIRRALRKSAAPIRKEARRLAPVADRDVRIGQKAKARIIEAGHLKKSLAIFVGKNKNWLNVQVGAREKNKGGFDAYYARFVHEGHDIVQTKSKLKKNVKKDGGGYQRFVSTNKKSKANPFLKKAADNKRNEAVTIFNKEIDNLIRQKFGR